MPPLRALVASGHEVALVITQPDRPRGRSGRPQPTAVARAADELGLPLERPRTINAPEVVARMSGTGATALCVAAFGQILREAVLDGFLCVNVHFSLLPAYRGAAPVERAIMDGRAETGVTIMRMDAGLDTGPEILRAVVAIGPEEDAGTLTARLAELGGDLLVTALDGLEAGRLTPRPQPGEGVSLAPRITAGDRVLDPTRPARALADRVRALAPHIGATCAIDGEPFKVWSARARTTPAPAGLSVDGEVLVMGCADGALELRELQPPGKGPMPAASFLRGYRGALALESSASEPDAGHGRPA